MFRGALFVLLFLVFLGSVFAQDSLNMRLLGRWDAPDGVTLWSWPVRCLAVDSDYVYVSGFHHLYVINISDPTDPNLVLEDSSFSYVSVGVCGDYIFSGNSAGLGVFRRYQEDSIVLQDTCACWVGNKIVVFPDSNYIAGFKSYDGISIVDVSDPTDPEEMYHIPLHFFGDEVNDIYLNYPYFFELYSSEYWDDMHACYVRKVIVCVTNYADMASPHYVRGWSGDYYPDSSWGGYPESVGGNDEAVYIFDQPGPDGISLNILSFNPDSSQLIQDTVYFSWRIGGDPHIIGNYMAIAGDDATIWDISNPTRPELEAYYNADYYPTCNEIFIKDSLLIAKEYDGISIYVMEGLQIDGDCRNETNNMDFQIFPNPVMKGAYINIASDYNNINLYDITGKRLKIIDGETPIIDTSDLPTGLCLLRININGYTIVKKLLVL